VAAGTLRAVETYLAVDLGAESGRVMAATFDGERIALKEAHRFANVPVRVPRPVAGFNPQTGARAGQASSAWPHLRAGAPAESLYWDVLSLWREMLEGLGRAGRAANAPRSIGVATWGVDYALLGADGALLGNPYHYRDRRTEGMVAEATRLVPREAIFERTGIQFLPFNTLYQLLAATRHHEQALRAARRLLMVPDLFHYWLSGSVAGEFTNATTTQAYDTRRREWATDLLEALGIDARLFPEVVPPGTDLGGVLPPVASEAGLAERTRVIAVATHDTGSAVAAVPVQREALGTGETYAYISSGTWSLAGVEVPEPVINAETLALDFTNEGGVGGVRLLKNVMGLWLIQEARRAWQRAGSDLSYVEIAALAGRAQPFAAIVDPDDPSFLAPGDMPGRLAEYCRATGQPVLEPGDAGQVARCALESLALRYRWIVERIERVIGQRIGVIHVIGGGSRNDLLNQLTADACRRPVLAGPAEATALGNALIQAMAAGRVASLDEGREIVRRSCDVAMFEPRDPAPWDEAYGKFLGLPERRAAMSG
jgi:rhamnulokinase